MSADPRPLFRISAAAALVLTMAACTPNRGGGDINDPFEAENRARFEANLALDRALGGGPGGDGPEVPAPVLLALSNVGTNLDAPGVAINHLLQGRPGDAVHMTLRFAVNSTLGLFGLFDPARDMGLEERDTDFGITLHAWGAPEGAYLVLPVQGPSTERDAAGMLVDAILNPFNFVLPLRERAYTVGAKFAGEAAERLRYGDSIDSVFYDSADPYAQARTLYLQNRTFELGTTAVEDTYIDPYADF